MYAMEDIFVGLLVGKVWGRAEGAGFLPGAQIPGGAPVPLSDGEHLGNGVLSTERPSPDVGSVRRGRGGPLLDLPHRPPPPTQRLP